MAGLVNGNPGNFAKGRSQTDVFRDHGKSAVRPGLLELYRQWAGDPYIGQGQLWRRWFTERLRSLEVPP
jgi:hypothetical protein